MNIAGSKWVLRLVGIVVLVNIFMRIDQAEMVDVFRDADWRLAVYAALCFALHLALKAARWNTILRYAGIHVAGWKAVEIYSAGALLGTITPGRIGEFAKALFVRHWHPEKSWGTALGTIVLDRAIDVAALVAVAALGAAWVGLPGEYRVAGEFLVLAFLAAGFFASLHVWRRLYRTSLFRQWKERADRAIGGSAADFYRVFRMAGHRQILPALGWTIAAYALFFLNFIVLARAMGSSLSPQVLSWGIALASLGALLPLTISGIGVRDFILIAVFAAWGEIPPRVLAISLSYLAILYITIPCMGIWPLLRGELDIKRILKSGRPTGESAT